MKEIVPNDVKAIKAAWTKFYNKEEEFLKYVHNTCTILHQEDVKLGLREHQLQYDKVMTKIATLSKPPRFIRLTAAVSDAAFANIEGKLTELKELYKKAWTASNSRKDKEQTNKQKKFKLPDRMAQLHPNANQVVVSKSTAHSSTRLNQNNERTNVYEIVTLAGASEESKKEIERTLLNIEECRKQLENMGLEPEVKNNSRDMLFIVDITVSTSRLFEYANTENITAREETGEQYTASLTLEDEDQLHKTKYGFLIVKENCTVYNAIPRKKRADALENKATRMNMPEFLTKQFWKY